MVAGVRALSDECPLLEFDPDENALFEPRSTQPEVDAPSAVVGCFNPAAIESALGETRREIMGLPSREPLWELSHRDRRVGLFYPGQGPSLAACVLERVIAAGCRSVVFCGGAGALVPELAMGHVVIVDSALRDEGTSFHYLAPARTVGAEPSVVESITATCIAQGVRFTKGRTWTTDAIFRETAGKIARRRDEGCITVENEASALLAVGAFRGVRVGVMLYAGDDVSGDAWDGRDWSRAWDVQARLLALALDAAIALDT
jgi:purine-nucleoside phosphorylase